MERWGWLNKGELQVECHKKGVFMNRFKVLVWDEAGNLASKYCPFGELIE